MGNAESHQDECNIDDKDTIQHNKKFFMTSIIGYLLILVMNMKY